MNNLILVDASHLFYRSYNVFPTLKTSKGEHTGVAFGTLRALEHLKTEVQDSVVVFCLDGSSQQRRTLCPTYKASRSHDTNVFDVGAQNTTQELLLACGVVLAYHPEYECDDLIGMLVRSEHYNRVLIYSGDDDFCQLVSERVMLWKPRSGKEKKDRFVGALEVFQEWNVAPESMALYRSFVGDASDEIKGLPRIPRALLQSAVARKVTPEEFYQGDSLAYFTTEWRQRLLEFRSQCELNFRLTKLPFDFLPSVPMQFTGIQVEKLREILSRLEFNSFLRKLPDGLNLLGAKPNAEQVPRQLG